MAQATASLTITLPKKGICEAPDAYHQILYALSAAKHGITNVDSTRSDLYKTNTNHKHILFISILIISSLICKRVKI